MEQKERKLHYGIVKFERRKHPRFDIDLPIEYSLLPSSVSHPGRALNASEGGLLVYLTEKVEINQLFELKLFFTSGSDLNGVELMAEVVWMISISGKTGGITRTEVCRYLPWGLEQIKKIFVDLVIPVPPRFS